MIVLLYLCSFLVLHASEKIGIESVPKQENGINIVGDTASLPIEKLPPEIQEKILSFLPRKQLFDTCKIFQGTKRQWGILVVRCLIMHDIKSEARKQVQRDLMEGTCDGTVIECPGYYF